MKEEERIVLEGTLAWLTVVLGACIVAAFLLVVLVGCNGELPPADPKPPPAALESMEDWEKRMREERQR